LGSTVIGELPKTIRWIEVREEPCYATELRASFDAWRLAEVPDGDVEAFVQARGFARELATTIAAGCASKVVRRYHFCDLCVREHMRAARAARSVAKASPGATDAELFAEGGNPPIRYTPREWTDAGRGELSRLPMSLQAPEALECYAAAQTMSARRNRAKREEPFAVEDDRHARLARGWARHLRAK
jgi:hypothetical protein